MPEALIEAVGLDVDKSPIMADRPGRILSHHAVMYIVKGNGYFEDTSTKRQAVAPGTVFYLYPNKWHNFDPDPGTRWTEYWVLFDGWKSEKIYGSLIPYHQSLFHLGLESSLVEAYEQLYELYFYRPAGYVEYCSFLLHRILVEFYLKIHQLRFEDSNDVIQRAKRRMKQALQSKAFNASAFSHSEKISYENFRKLFKLKTGFSPKNYFLMLKMNQAKEILVQSRLPIKQIALNLGFDDPYYFSKLFKEKIGLSPKGYRQRHWAPGATRAPNPPGPPADPPRRP